MYYDKFWMRHFDDAADSTHLSFGKTFKEKVISPTIYLQLVIFTTALNSFSPVDLIMRGLGHRGRRNC
jgi:hypothetical protein